jgi:hypothetical protein
MRDNSEVERVYQVFDSLDQFSTAATAAVGRLVQHLASKNGDAVEEATGASEDDATLPRPPTLAALPRYLGSHPFVGRASELQTLTDWCGPADPNSMLLFEAMGGSGKSMLTWEWLTNHATSARDDWAGRFWYSFYEKGAVMAGFCRQALAYMTMKPVEDFAKLRTPALSDRLVAELERHPWLMVLDGLERILVAYHRHDAAQLRDEEADTAADQIGKRDPCAAIRPEDDELLRRLAAAAPSKVLVTSRLTPLALVRSGVRVPGVRREILPGLRPADSEAMIRACGVTGRSQAIQAYLQMNCDCHPLVVGALAGLINNYPPDRGNFDCWVDDPHHGGALNLAEVDLVQRRNHILSAAIDALAAESRQLLQTLALLQGGADFETLKALNPHLPPKPEEVKEPRDPIHRFPWSRWDEELRAREKAHYERKVPQRQAYVEALAAWKSDPAVRAAPAKLGDTIRDLEKRGLLQYDLNGKRYDLHPVVRGVAAGRMGEDETKRLGQKVVDYFTSQPHDPWEKAETLGDVADGLQIVQVLLRMERYKEALRTVAYDLGIALVFNLDATAESQTLLKPFFPDGWEGEPVPVDPGALSVLFNYAAQSLLDTDPDQARKLAERMISSSIGRSNAIEVNVGLHVVAVISINANRLAEANRLIRLALQVGEVAPDNEAIFVSTNFLFRVAMIRGDRETADRLWQKIDGMGREWSRAAYRPGSAELWRAVDLFYRGELTEEILTQAEILAKSGRNRHAIQSLQRLRGEWCLKRDQPALAVESLAEAVRMAHEVGHKDERSEAMLALARIRIDEPFDARVGAERLGKTSERAALTVAELWWAVGERDRAVEHALRAHSWVAADGEPYVHRYYLDRARALLTDLGAELPEVPQYDSSKVTPYPWEKDVRVFIDKLRAERVAEKTKRKARVANRGDKNGE